MKKVVIYFVLMALGFWFTPICFAQADEDFAGGEIPGGGGEFESPSGGETAVQQEPPLMRVEQQAGDSFSMEFRDVEVGDLLRVFAHDYGLNILVDKDVKGEVTASFSNISLEEALKVILKNNNLALEKDGNIIRVFPHLIAKTFVLRSAEAKELLEGARSSSGSESGEGGEGGEGVGGAGGEGDSGGGVSGENTIYDLLSQEGKIFLGKLPNSLLVIDYPPNVKNIESYLEAVDRKTTSRVFKLKYISSKELVGVEEEGEVRTEEYSLDVGGQGGGDSGGDSGGGGGE